VEVTSIDCVLCSSKREFNKYVRIESDESTTSVDYISIITKLIKSDFHDVEPHPFIVGMAIKNALNNIRKKQNSDRVIYLMKNCDMETIENFKELVYDMFESLEEIKLVAINMEPIDDTIVDMFDSHTYLQF
jgi:hypothetical protein|tara:strand:- start:760 stop:1155 length:396 start_codon:yes stop_codon:yes gene_type:complete